MASADQGMRVRGDLGRKAGLFELSLSRRVFARGRQLSGVVLLRLARPVSVKAIMVSVTGGEFVSGTKLTGSIRAGTVFFRRDVLLSGRDRPRLISDRLSQYWKAFLKRERYRTLSAGEHTYPFTVALPASLPPSCEGRAGRVAYFVTARVKFPLGRAFQVTAEASVAFSAGDLPDEPFSLSHSSVYSGMHATGADMKVDLPSRSFDLGSNLTGILTIMNPRRARMESITVSLDVCDGARTGPRGGVVDMNVQTVTIVPDDPSSPEIKADLDLSIPPDAPPSVEGKVVLVTWSLNVHVEACPPLDLRVPVIVRLSAG